MTQGPGRLHSSLSLSRGSRIARITRCSFSSKSRGFSLIELLIVVAIILIIASISIPNLLRSRMSAHEAAAVASLRAISSACQVYSITYGPGYPSSLAQLGPVRGAGNGGSADAADLIDEVLAAGAKSGYLFTYTPGAADATGAVSSYAVVAVPMVVGSTGQRGFYTDQTGAIRFTLDGTEPTAASPTLN